MKTIEKFAKRYSLEVRLITYNFQGIVDRRKGYDLIDKDGNIILSFEPKQYNFCPDKWYLRHVHHSYTGSRYFTRITNSILESLPLQPNGFKLANYLPSAEYTV
jgi:hypothetical protein